MKKILLFSLSALLYITTNAQTGVSINNTGASADASAMLDVSSTDTGLLIPRMTEAERDLIASGSPATGLMIYQTDGTAGFYYYDGAAWVSATGAKSINDLSDGKTNGQFNSSTYLGDGAGHLATGNHNVGFGSSSLANSTGSENTAIGHQAGLNITTGTFNILLGKDVEPSSVTVSNELNIGNLIYGTNVYNATGNVGIGNGNNVPTSTLSVAGSMSLPFDFTGGTNITLTESHYTMIVNGSETVTLPLSTACKGRIYVIKAIGSGGGVVNTTGIEEIDGQSSILLANPYDFIKVQSSGVGFWFIIGQND